MRRSLAVLAAALVLTTSALSEAGTGSQSKDCGGSHTLSWSPTILWPPNHKLNQVEVRYVDANSVEGSEHTLSLQVTSVTVLDSLKGSGNTSPDFAFPQQPTTGTGSVSVPLLLRAERAGTGDGRIYEIHYEATAAGPGGGQDNDCGSAATGVLRVVVPHDCRQGACRGISS